jgi:predicted transcriptional regulator
MTNTAVFTIAIADLKPNVPKEGTLEDRLRETFRHARESWVLSDMGQQIMAGILAVRETADEHEKERIDATLAQIKALNAVISGVPVDVEAAAARWEGVELLPVRRLWDESKGEPGG